jgi:hypothetical protein
MSYEAISLIGDLKLGPLAGAGEDPLYYMDDLNATAITLNPGSIKTAYRVGRGRDTNGQNLNTLTQPDQVSSIEVKNDTLSPDVLAMQLRGLTSQGTNTGAAVVDRELVVKLDEWVPIYPTWRRLAATAMTATADPGPTPAYTEGTHFLVNRRLAMVKFLSGVAGAPADGATVLLGYSTDTYTYNRVAGGGKLPSRFRVMYDCVNQATGKDGILYIPQALITPSGNLDLIVEAFAAGTLTLTPEKLTGEVAAYYYDEIE